MNIWGWYIPVYCQNQFCSSCLWPGRTDPRYLGLLHGTEWRHRDGWRSPTVWMTLDLRYVCVNVFVWLYLYVCVRSHVRKTVNFSPTFPETTQICLFVCLAVVMKTLIFICGFVCVYICVWLCRPGMLTCPSAWQSNQSWKREDYISMEVCIPRADSLNYLLLVRSEHWGRFVYVVQLVCVLQCHQLLLSHAHATCTREWCMRFVFMHTVFSISEQSGHCAIANTLLLLT